MWFLFMKTFLVYKLETFTNCKEVKRIIIMIIVIIYIFLSYEMCDQQLEITFRKPLASHHPSSWKNPDRTPQFYLLPL